ncbi:MAG: glycosyltransferase family 2 protein, partial [Planctomycetaceae bacterium]
MNPAVSIVISTRNRRDDVVRAVASSLSQHYEPFEVLLYDDAST